VRKHVEPLLLALLVALAIVLPARWVLSADQGNGSAIRWAYLGGGLVCDVAVLFPLLALGGLLGGAVVRRAPRMRAVLVVGAALVLLLLLFTSNASTLFHLERGHLPDAHDVSTGLGHSDFARAELPALALGPFALGNLVALAVMGFSLRRAVRLTGRPRARLPLTLVAAAAVGGLLFFGSAKAQALTRSLHADDAVASPIAHLAASALRDEGAADLRSAVLATHGSREDVVRGAALYGFSEATAARVLERDAVPTCDEHPLRQELDADPTSWTAAATGLSQALFRDRAVAPVVFHVSLESTRADDVATLRASAPRAIAPFLSDVFDSAKPHEGTFPFRLAFQSGVRTAQALAAVTCGVGAAPLHLAFGRDLGNVPLRCAPDVLADAGFTLSATYGHELVFDDMATFLRFHGFATKERRDLPTDAPRGVWNGVSDATVYRTALADALARPGAQYSFVLTLTNHTPYDAPGDVTPEDARAIDALCKERDLSGENCDRLLTLRYADRALREFLEAIAASPLADRAVVVVMADHTTHVREPWESDLERPAAISQIPGFVWIAPGLRAGANADLASAEARFAAQAATAPLSNADVPRLLLALLSASAPLRALPAAARWHTLPGATTSAQFRGLDEGEVAWGITAHAELFGIEPDGHVARKPVVVDPSQRAAAMDPRLRGALAFWGAFLRGYGDCTTARGTRD
jgi:hypothetical protein